MCGYGAWVISMFTPHIIVRHTEELIEEGASIFCAEMFGNGVVHRVSRMRGSYISLDAKFLNHTQSWTDLKHRMIIVPSRMIWLPWAHQIWLFLSILYWLFFTLEGYRFSHPQKMSHGPSTRLLSTLIVPTIVCLIVIPPIAICTYYLYQMFNSSYKE
jgi:hypothetical protein